MSGLLFVQRWHCDPCGLNQTHGVRSAIVNKLCCTGVCFESVSCPHHPSIFSDSHQETEITTITQIMLAAMSSNSFAFSKSAIAILKTWMLLAGCPWLSGMPPSSLAIDIVVKVSSSFNLLILSLIVDVVDVSVSEFVPSPPNEHRAFLLSKHLAFSDIFEMHRQILVAVEEVFGIHQHSNEIQCLTLSCRSARVAVIIMSFKNDAIVKHNFLFVNIELVRTMFRESLDGRRALTVVISQMSPSSWWLWSSFRCVVPWFPRRIFLNDRVRDWNVVVIRLLICVRTSLFPQISPATAINDPDFWKGIAISTLKFCIILGKFEDLCVKHIFEWFFRFLAESVDLRLFTDILKELFFPCVNVSRSSWKILCR